MQLELFDYRRDYLFDSENQIAHWYDILKETEDSISYAEHIDPKKGYAICGMEYEEYVDVKKNKLSKLTYDQILNFLRETKKDNRIDERFKVYKNDPLVFSGENVFEKHQTKKSITQCSEHAFNHCYRWQCCACRLRH